MKTPSRQPPRGIALIIVMICITVLSILAAGFAYAMKVETKLAMNSNSEAELTWLGISGVELAKYVVAMQDTPQMRAQEPYDCLNQKWAGGPGAWDSTNSALADISLDGYPLGNGKFSIKIVDLERKVNINTADQAMLEQAFRLVGVDGGDFSSLANCILDWIDDGDSERVGGAESSFYQSQEPPYYARNRPMDDLSDLMLIKGVTQDIYEGGVGTNRLTAAFQKSQQRMFGNNAGVVTYPVGLKDIFTAVSGGRINIDTCSATALQMIPGVDENIAMEMIRYRAGPDGVDGTADDTPFRNVGEVQNVPGVNQQVLAQVQRYGEVRSRTFEVQVEAEINGYKRHFVAIIGRNSPRDVQTLTFSWK